MSGKSKLRIPDIRKSNQIIRWITFRIRNPMIHIFILKCLVNTFPRICCPAIYMVFEHYMEIFVISLNTLCVRSLFHYVYPNITKTACREVLKDVLGVA